MPLDLDDCRVLFAEKLAECAREHKGFERALMAVVQHAYQRGMEDAGQEPTTEEKDDD